MREDDLIIGSFRHDQYGVLCGHIGIFGLGSIEVTSKDVVSNNECFCMKLIADPLGAAYEIGTAFPQLDQKDEYFIVELDSPFLRQPIVAFLLQDEGDECKFNLIWNRAASN